MGPSNVHWHHYLECRLPMSVSVSHYFITVELCACLEQGTGPSEYVEETLIRGQVYAFRLNVGPTCLGGQSSYIQPDFINLKSNQRYQFGSLHCQRHISMYVLMLQLPGSTGFPTPSSSMSHTQCLNNEAPVVILAQNSVENAPVVPLCTCCFVHKFWLKLPHCLHVGRDLRDVAGDSLGKCQLWQRQNGNFLISGRGWACLVVDLALASLQGLLKFNLTMLMTFECKV